MTLAEEALQFVRNNPHTSDQHFLVDESIIEKEIEYAELTSTDVVLEIGGGLGFLTSALAEQAKVVVIEKDIRFIAPLKRTGAEVIHGDALRVALPPADKFVSNIPYSISLPLTLRLLRTPCKTGVLIVQEEFAKKLAAKPGSDDYGRISVLAQYYAEVELLDRVKRNAFVPQPHVGSRIVAFTRLRPENKGFEDYITDLFRQRRKLVPGTDKRPEQLSVEELIALHAKDI